MKFKTRKNKIIYQSKIPISGHFPNSGQNYNFYLKRNFIFKNKIYTCFLYIIIQLNSGANYK